MVEIKKCFIFSGDSGHFVISSKKHQFNQLIDFPKNFIVMKFGCKANHTQQQYHWQYDDDDDVHCDQQQ